MSRNEWEEGTIVLPKAEFARVRQAVADKVTARNEALYAKSQEFWAGLTAKQKRDPGAYYQAFEAFEAKHTKRVYNGWGSETVSTLPDGLRGVVRAHGASYSTTAPKRVLKTDLEFPTNKTLAFVTERYDGSMSFDRDKSTVTWHVSENNHAVRDAHEDVAAQAFFGALATVKWTRGTGGVLTGNDEYSREDRSDGGGSNYVTNGFGPIGAVDAPNATDEFVMADGTKVRRADYEALAKKAAAAQRREWNKVIGKQGHRPAGSPAGGQFTDRYRSSPEATLGRW